MPKKLSPKSKVTVDWKYASRPAKPATAFSPAGQYRSTSGPVARAVANGVKAQPMKSRKNDPDRERLATADAVSKVLKSKSSKFSLSKGNAVMNKKSSKSVSKKAVKVASPAKSKTAEKVSRRFARALQYDEPVLRKIEREASVSRLARKESLRKIMRNEPDTKVTRKEAAARMKRSLENYPKNPKVWEASEHEDDGKKGGKRVRNQRGTAADRKAAAKALSLQAREQKKLDREQRQADRLAARLQKQAEREDRARLRNLPALLFTPKMLKDVMTEFQNNVDGKVNERRLERLSVQAERLSKSSLKKVQNRIKNMQRRIQLMEALLTIGKAALDDGYDKYLAPIKRGGKGKRLSFGKKAGERPAPEKPARLNRVAKERKTAKAVPVKKEHLNGSAALAAKVKGLSGKDRKAAIAAAMAMQARVSKR